MNMTILNNKMEQSIFDIKLVEPEELFETTNPALQKVVEFQKTLRFIDKKTFYSNINKIVGTVCKHFGIAMIALLVFAVQSARADVLSIARLEIGHGEMFGNNRGFYVRQYLNGREGLPWCAGFVSYCAKKSGLNIPYTLLAKDFLRLGKKVNNPQSGDLIVFSRKGGGHVGIVEKVTKDTITTIEGNLGEYPSKVKRVNYKKNHIKNFLGFVRLARAR
jgi:uncharacterized protein (TIGR02594 family)